MTRALILTLTILLASTSAWAANLATGTPISAFTPAATPSPDTAQVRSVQNPVPGGDVVQKPNVYEGGLQIGTEAAGASLLTFLKRGTCVVDPPAFAAVATPTVGIVHAVKITCAATGAAVGDSVFVSPQVYSGATADAAVEYNGMKLHAAWISAADTLAMTFTHGSLAGLDPAPLTVHYLVVR